MHVGAALIAPEFSIDWCWSIFAHCLWRRIITASKYIYLLKSVQQQSNYFSATKQHIDVYKFNIDVVRVLCLSSAYFSFFCSKALSKKHIFVLETSIPKIIIIIIIRLIHSKFNRKPMSSFFAARNRRFLLASLSARAKFTFFCGGWHRHNQKIILEQRVRVQFIWHIEYTPFCIFTTFFVELHFSCMFIVHSFFIPIMYDKFN